MADSHGTSRYITVFWWLLGLTIGEVGVIFMHLPRLLLVLLLVGFALSKAALVAMYFMHLKFEARTLGVIVLTPLALCVLLVFALLPDHSATPHKTTTPPSPTAPPAPAH